MGKKAPPPRFGGIYFDAQGKERPCYYLPKREVMILVSGYSIKLRAAVVDRLEYFENQSALPPGKEPTRMELIKLALEAETERLEAEKKIKQLEYVNTKNTPKVEVYDQFFETDGYFTLRGAFKSLDHQAFKKRIPNDKEGADKVKR